MRSRWAVLISGTGSNLQSVLDRCFEPMPLVVYSSKALAPGLSKARRMGIPTVVLPNPIDWAALQKDLENRRIQKIFLLGFMKILPESFVQAWENRMFNLHPSLLPAYPGLHSFEKAYQDKAPLGVTVHKVIAELDAGPMLKQRSFLRGDTESETRLRLSWTEQALVREVMDYE